MHAVHIVIYLRAERPTETRQRDADERDAHAAARFRTAIAADREKLDSHESAHQHLLQQHSCSCTRFRLARTENAGNLIAR